MNRDPYDVQPGDCVVVESPVFVDYSGEIQEHENFTGPGRPKVGDVFTVQTIDGIPGIPGVTVEGGWHMAPGSLLRLDALDTVARLRAPKPEPWIPAPLWEAAVVEPEWPSALSPQQSARAEALWQARSLLGEPEVDLYRYRQALLDLADFITYGKDPAA